MKSTQPSAPPAAGPGSAMRILLIEDDAPGAALTAAALTRDGHGVGIATDGREALARAACDPWDLLIVDRMLPGLDGLALVRMLRAGGITTPALFLTALGDVADRVAGLRAGGDDYLVKPFALAELSARVEALGRRRDPAPNPARTLCCGDLTLDPLTRTARRAGRVLAMQNVEYRILERLLRAAGRVVTRTMLLEDIWGFHFEPRTNVVESNISRLRAKLGQPALADGPIETVRGVGYRIRADAGR